MQYAIPALIMVVAAAAAFALALPYLGQQLPKSVTISQATYNITAYAITPGEQEKGLMNSTVNGSTFMLFVFPGSRPYPFWMKDTYSYLDIIWINATGRYGRIVYFVNATPCAKYDSAQVNCTLYIPPSGANYVLETASGFDRRNAVYQGEHIEFG